METHAASVCFYPTPPFAPDDFADRFVLKVVARQQGWRKTLSPSQMHNKRVFSDARAGLTALSVWVRSMYRPQLDNSR